MIELEKNGALWTAIINRPQKANSLTETMLNELAEIVENATDARALVFTGRGNVFSAGADLDEARAGLALSSVWERLSGAIARFDGLSIAALNGTLAGGAMGMALACDIRLAAPHAKFFYPVMKLGFLPQPSDPARLKSLVGPSRAKLILMGGQKLTAQEALSFGLIDKIAPQEKLLAHAEEIASDVMAAKPEVVTGIKEMI